MPIINLDLSQVEVVVFAHLCKDPTLVNLLKNGKDIHYYIASQILNKSESEVTKEERSTAKTSTFGIIYGNGAKTLSERVNKPQDWCKAFIKQFYEMFPKAKEWHNDILLEVEATGQLTLFTNQVLKFTKYPAKYDWQDKNKLYYNPPDIKNHPVQSIAALLMAILAGEFWRTKALINRDKYLMINTVHDSLMLDCRPQYVDQAVSDLQEIVDRLPQIVYNNWKESLIVPIKCEIKGGNSWAEV